MSKLIQNVFEFEAPTQNSERAADAELVILSMGLGQESTALLYKYVYDKEFRSKYAPNRFLVIHSETGNEFPETNAHGLEIVKFCQKHNIEYVSIVPEMGYHGKGWSSLQDQFTHNRSIMGRSLAKSCTDRLKVKPFHRYLENWIADNYITTRGRKSAHKAFAKIYGKVDVWLGFAKGEEKRCRDGEFDEPWKNQSIRHVYPLIDEGMDRQACQNYIASVGEVTPPPSNCIMCPYCSEQELLYMHRFHRVEFEKWAAFEADKIKRDEERGKEMSLGVWGTWNKEEGRAYTLYDALKTAEKKYGSMSNEELREYRFSHGHCVASKY